MDELVGPDVVLYAPTEELTESELRPNARRRRARVEFPEVELYGGYEGLLVRTALIRSDKYRAGAPLPVVHDAASSAELVRHIADADQEFIVTIAVNAALNVVALHEASIGGTSATGVEGRHLIKVALLTGARGLIVCHNHPSGSPDPSREDVALTWALREMAACVDLEVFDHIIVAHEGYSSMLEGTVYSWPVPPRFRGHRLRAFNPVIVEALQGLFK